MTRVHALWSRVAPFLASAVFGLAVLSAGVSAVLTVEIRADIQKHSTELRELQHVAVTLKGAETRVTGDAAHIRVLLTIDEQLLAQLCRRTPGCTIPSR